MGAINLFELAKAKGISAAFKDQLSKLDDNHDAVIDGDEIQDATPDELDAIRNMASTQMDWDVVREVALIKGTYRAINEQIEKGTAPGEGGRFALMVDSLIDRGYSPDHAKAIAVKIGRMKYDWM